ncbi:hypothetical protein LDENG_00294860, partial [Lucifuga dentata]
SLRYFKSRLRSVAFLTHGSTSLQRVTQNSQFQAETLNKTWSDQVKESHLRGTENPQHTSLTC